MGSTELETAQQVDKDTLRRIVFRTQPWVLYVEDDTTAAAAYIEILNKLECLIQEARDCGMEYKDLIAIEKDEHIRALCPKCSATLRPSHSKDDLFCPQCKEYLWEIECDDWEKQE